jgi:hypothetical protein
VHVVLGQRGNAEGVVHQHLAVALGHAHGREDGARGVGSHEQFDLVGGDQLLVQGAGQIGLGLIVTADPLHLATEQATACVELLDVNVAHQFVRQAGGRQRPGQGQGAADANRRALRACAGGHRQGCPGSASCQHRASIDLLHGNLLLQLKK